MFTKLIEALKAMTHKRVHFIWDDIAAIAGGNTDKGEVSDIRRRSIAALQLHEYWVTDESESEMQETLQEYADRCGLTLEPVARAAGRHEIEVTLQP